MRWKATTGKRREAANTAPAEQGCLRQKQSWPWGHRHGSPARKSCPMRGPVLIRAGWEPLLTTANGGQGPATHLPCSRERFRNKRIKHGIAYTQHIRKKPWNRGNTWPGEQMHHSWAPGLPDVRAPSVVSCIQISTPTYSHLHNVACTKSQFKQLINFFNEI